MTFWQCFPKKKQADDHIKVYSGAQSAWPHQVIKKNWKGRIIDFLIDTRRYWKLVGVMIIYFTVISEKIPAGISLFVLYSGNYERQNKNYLYHWTCLPKKRNS